MSESRKLSVTICFCALALSTCTYGSLRQEHKHLGVIPPGYEVRRSDLDGLFKFTIRAGTFSYWMAATFVDSPNIMHTLNTLSAVNVVARLVADLDQGTVRRILIAPDSTVGTKTPLEDLSAGIAYAYVFCAQADSTTVSDGLARARPLLQKVVKELGASSAAEDRTWKAMALIALARLGPGGEASYNDYAAAARLKPFKYPHLDAFVDRGVYDELVLQKRYSEASHARALLMKEYKAYRGWQILLL